MHIFRCVLTYHTAARSCCLNGVHMRSIPRPAILSIAITVRR